MDTLHIQYLVDADSKREAVILPMAEWERIVEELEELDDIRARDEAKAGSQENDKTSKKKALTLVDYNEVVASFHEESDRGAAILAASFVDCYLEEFLRCFMKEGKVANTLLKRALHASAAKADCALAFGLITKELHRDLRFIRDIRNHFAHYPLDVDFGSEKVENWCRLLSTSQKDMPLKDSYLFSVGLAVGTMHNTMLNHRNKKEDSSKQEDSE